MYCEDTYNNKQNMPTTSKKDRSQSITKTSAGRKKVGLEKRSNVRNKQEHKHRKKSRM
jgi:hypothetical protein